MGARIFDPLAYFEKLKEAGVPEGQAKIQAEALRDLADGRPVTRDYLDARLNEFEYRIIVKLGGIATALAGIIIAAVGLMLK